MTGDPEPTPGQFVPWRTYEIMRNERDIWRKAYLAVRPLVDVARREGA